MHKLAEPFRFLYHATFKPSVLQKRMQQAWRRPPPALMLGNSQPQHRIYLNNQCRVWWLAGVGLLWLLVWGEMSIWGLLLLSLALLVGGWAVSSYVDLPLGVYFSTLGALIWNHSPTLWSQLYAALLTAIPGWLRWEYGAVLGVMALLTGVWMALGIDAERTIPTRSARYQRLTLTGKMLTGVWLALGGLAVMVIVIRLGVAVNAHPLAAVLAGIAASGAGMLLGLFAGYMVLGLGVSFGGILLVMPVSWLTNLTGTPKNTPYQISTGIAAALASLPGFGLGMVTALAVSMAILVALLGLASLPAILGGILVFGVTHLLSFWPQRRWSFGAAGGLGLLFAGQGWIAVLAVLAAGLLGSSGLLVRLANRESAPPSDKAG